MSLETQAAYSAPDTKYFLTKEEFNEAVGRDFIYHANRSLKKGFKFLVGLSHGQSPSGAYQYIIDHFKELYNSKEIYFTFVNTPLKDQVGLADVFDACSFLKKNARRGIHYKRTSAGKI